MRNMKYLVVLNCGILMNELARSIGKQIKLLRVDKELKQSDVSQVINIDPSYLGRIERGEINISVETLARIASALECKPSDILMAIDL